MLQEGPVAVCIARAGLWWGVCACLGSSSIFWLHSKFIEGGQIPELLLPEAPGPGTGKPCATAQCVRHLRIARGVSCPTRGMWGASGSLPEGQRVDWE